MAKVKETLLNGMSQHEIDTYLYNKQFRDMEYEEWLQSEEYADYVNEELENTKLIYSDYDVLSSLDYASKSIVIEPYEVGKEVYNKLFSEKVVEYLNKSNER